MGVLDAILERIREERAAERLPIVLFDVDSTLVSTKPRNAAIAREFAAVGAHLHPAVERLADCQPDEMGWLVSDALRARGCEDEAVLEALMDFWFTRFFAGDTLVHDVEVPGAVAFARAVHDAGALVYYLTGRDAPNMGAQTVESLGKLGFPLWRGRVVLHLKPTRAIGDRAYKAGAVDDVRSHLGPVVACFENDPGNANLFVEAFPDAIHVWMQTECAPDADAPRPELLRIADFTG
ncbi:MAG: haloacid dehalogenase-like hydrolase [Deltaproteobacteria bacterium]|nr:MAG: haloacid dehalogenase-like hydrolase [Deltaproteobacteria bacterium]